MASQIMVQAVAARHVMPLNSVDFGLISDIEHPFLRIVWLASGGDQRVNTRQLLNDARSFHELILGQWTLLPYRYSFEARMPGLNLPPSRDSGGTGGFRIGGDHHCIWARAGRCYLQRYGVREDGRGIVLETIDVRGKKQVDTDDWGTIRIFRKKLNSNLPEEISSLIRFLGGVADAEVSLQLRENPSSIAGLLRQIAEGDDAAEEELFNRGESARKELIVKLQDAKAKKLHGTIARALLMLFPSAESRTAVERLIENERNPERRATFVGLLAATGSEARRLGR